MATLMLVMAADAVHPEFAQEQAKDYPSNRRRKFKKRSRRWKALKLINEAIRSCQTYHR